MMTCETIERVLLSPHIEEGFKTCLDMWEEGDGDQAKALGDWIRALRDDYVQAARDIDDPEGLETVFAHLYINLKSQWTVMNTRINYGMVATGMPNMNLMFKASLLTGLLEAIEGLLKYRDVDNIVSFLAEPVLPEKAIGSVVEVELSYMDSVFKYMDEMTVSHMLMGGHLEIMQSEIQKQSQQGSRNKVFDHCMNTLAQSYSELDRSSMDFQQSVVKLRTTKCTDLAEKIMAFVDYTSQRERKEVQCEFVGKDIEIEKFSAKFLQQPLLNLLRATILFGIESPEDREAAGKKERATIRVTAAHHGNFVLMEIEDDGKGFEMERVAEEVARLNPGASQDWAMLSDTERTSLLLATKASTSFEGEEEHRGSTLPAIHQQILQLGGTFAVEVQPGGATRFALTVPACFTIVSLMLVRVGKGRFGVPLELVREVTAISTDDIATAVTRPFVTLRGACLPVINMIDLLELKGYSENQSNQDIPMLVVQVGDEQMALAVSEIIGHVSGVMKPLPEMVSTENVVLGTTMLSDGGIVPILNAVEIFKEAGKKPRSNAWTTGKQVRSD